MLWKYKIELETDSVFNEYEQKYGISFSSELIEFIKKTNGATPENSYIKLNNKEYEIGAVLSFNKDDRDVDLFKTAMLIGIDNRYIPFAVSPDGNYFCVDSNNYICYWSHEENKIMVSDIVIGELEEKLYQ